MEVQEIRESLKASGIKIIQEGRNGNNTGFRLECDDGAIVNIFDSGKLSVQGRNAEKVRLALGLGPKGESLTDTNASPRLTRPKVFVVYGHDDHSKHELEAMLLRWGLEPLILDNLPSAGATLIEKLENYCQANRVSFAVVLATPDDVGYPKEREDLKRARARQNVVLELGMVLAKLGRARVAILRPPKEQMEAPSDIDGLVYLEYQRSVSDRKAELAREIEAAIPGFTVPASKL